MKTNKLRLHVLLSFSDAQYEKAFIAHYVEFYRRYAQVSMLLGVVLVLGDFLVDYFAHPGVRANFFRVWICVPILFAGLGYSFLQQAKRNWQSTMSAFIVAVALILFWILLLIDQEGGPGLKTWVGVLNFTFLTLYCFVILGVQFRFALFAGIVILVAFESAMWFGFAMEKVQVAYWTYHVVTVFILAAAIGWWREYLLRMEYLARMSLDEARQSAEHITKTKSEFLANMSHEIRTPLNGILGMAEVCLETTLDEDQKHFVGVITKEATSLLEIINEILDLSKIEAEKMEIEQVPFDLKALFNDLIESFSFQAAQKGLELISSVSPETPTRIVGDPGRLRQILRNLIGNAIKFTHAGRIVVEVEPAEEQGDRIKLRFLVKDTGIGIPKEMRALVFESFTQADGSTTRKYGGTGLGLTISKRLAELMGGEIAIESELGKGSTFWFTAFFQESDAQTIDELAATGKDHEYALATNCRWQGRVLLVEDYKTNQLVFTEHLNRVGVDVTIADNGKIAVDLFMTTSFDLIFMDVLMPEMDGLTATKLIREHEGQTPEKHTPIVALTAAIYEGDRNACHKAGMDDFLEKPFKRGDLMSILAKWLGPAQAYLPDTEIILPHVTAANGEDLPDTLPGLEIKEAMTILSCRKDTYLKIAASFYQENIGVVQTIQDSFSRQDWPNLEKLAHSLKSTSATIGARSLQAKALAIEKSSREAADKSADRPPAPEFIDALATACNEVLQSLAPLVETAFPVQAKSPCQACDPKQLASILQQIKDAIAISDMDSIHDRLEDIKQNCDDEAVARLEQQIDNYDYEEALQTLQEIADRNHADRV